MGELLDRIDGDAEDEEFRVQLSVHSHWLYAGGEAVERPVSSVGGSADARNEDEDEDETVTRVAPGGPWKDRFESWVGNFDGPSVGITTLRYLDDDPEERSASALLDHAADDPERADATHPVAADLLYGHADHDLVHEDARKGNLGPVKARKLLASAVVADDGTPDRVPNPPGPTDAETPAPVADLVPPTDPAVEDLDPDRVFERYREALDADPDDLTPAALERLDPEHVTSAYDQALLYAAEDGAVDGSRLASYRDRWAELTDRFEDAYEAFVDDLIGRIDVVEMGGGTYTKCQSRVVESILEGTDDLRVEINTDATFTIDMEREHPATQRGLDPEPLDDRETAEAYLAGAPPSLEASSRDDHYPVVADAIEQRSERYFRAGRVGFTGGLYATEESTATERGTGVGHG